MQRRIEADDRAALWIERIVWNAAAAAALAVMILVLLGSLRWLDQVVPRSGRAAQPTAVSSAAVGAKIEPSTAAVNRPAGEAVPVRRIARTKRGGGRRQRKAVLRARPPFRIRAA